MTSVLTGPRALATVEIAAGASFAPEVPGVYLILQGRVRYVHVTDEGQAMVTGVLGAGEAFIFRRPWLPGSPSGYVEAYEEAALLVVRERDIAELSARQPTLAAAITRALMRQTTDLLDMVGDLVLANARERVLRTLIRLADRHGVPSAQGDYVRIAVPLKHRDLATLVGACRETVTNVLADLAATGAVHTGRATISVCRARAIDLLEESRDRHAVTTTA